VIMSGNDKFEKKERLDVSLSKYIQLKSVIEQENKYDGTKRLGLIVMG